MLKQVEDCFDRVYLIPDIHEKDFMRDETELFLDGEPNNDVFLKFDEKWSKYLQNDEKFKKYLSEQRD